MTEWEDLDDDEDDYADEDEDYCSIYDCLLPCRDREDMERMP